MKNISHSLARWTTTLALGALVCGAAQASAVLVTQGPEPAGGSYLSTATTQNAESFTLDFAASLSAFQWWGSDLDVSRFTVRFYDGELTDNDGFTPLTVSDALLIKTASNEVDPCSDLLLCKYTLTLDTAISTKAHRKYFLAVFADRDAIWGWQEGAEGDGKSYFRDEDGTPWQDPSSPDLSLAVIGDRIVTPVPEPASLALAALALAGAGALRRRSA